MTCIVGLVDRGTVWIGGDSAGSDGYRLFVRQDKKVFRNGPFLMGGTTSFRLLDLLRYSLVPPQLEDGEDAERFMATKFIDAVRECFKTGGYATKSNEQESGGTFLVGFQGRLFQVGNDYQVGECACGYDAVGCGADIALGVLYATSDLHPDKRIDLALRASEQHNIGVRGPFYLESV